MFEKQNLNIVASVLLLGFWLGGCSSLRGEKSEKKFVIERSWARHTVQGNYLGARLNHVMEPVLYSGLVISGNEIDGLVAYDEKSGQKKWGRLIDGGVTASARIHKGALYFGAGDGFFYSLDAQTGKTKWAFPIKSEGIGAPLVTDEVVYFIAGNNSAYALKAGSGEQIWFYSRVDNANITVRGASEPSLYENRVYLGFSDGYLVALDKTKGTLVWEKQLGSGQRFRDVDSKPVISNGRVYVSSYDGQLYCLKISNGETVWVHDEGGFSPVVIDQDRLYYSTSTRKLLALEKSSGHVLWSLDLKNTTAGMPTVHRGLVLFGEWSGGLKAVDQRTGKEIAQFITGRGVTSRPVLGSGQDRDMIYVMTADANLFALRLRLRDRQEEWPWEN